MIQMLKRIGSRVDPWGTPYKLYFASDMIISIFTEYVLSLLLLLLLSGVRCAR